MDGQMYCNCLDGELKRSLNNLPNKAQILYQQDLTSWHTSKIVLAKIKKMKLNMSDWAPKSCDLNPGLSVRGDSDLETVPKGLRKAIIEGYNVNL
ncbi:unnamed protein product, partial [Rotaria sp. Silwood2]